MYRDEGPLSIPEYAVMARVLDEDLYDALEELPDEFRGSVLLCDVGDYSYGEIAEELEIPLGTVRSRIFRGRERLKEGLRECAQYSGLEGGRRSTRRAEATVA
jgi:RNA polymerase sigma-70 factor (ECF subfamily)